MRSVSLLCLLMLVLAGCKKDKFTTVPQIKYKSVAPTKVVISGGSIIPVLTFNITDSEGDLGITKKDTAYIYMKNVLTNDFDSIAFPDINSAAVKNFSGDVNVTLTKVFKCKSRPGNPLHTDTLYFDIYVKDFAKNKSNVIRSGDPVLFTCF